MSALRRLNTELKNMTETPAAGINAGPEGDDMFHWKAALNGPEDTPYQGGIFFLDIQIPTDYPFHPPKLKFTTPVYHPSVDDKGAICQDVFEKDWTPASNIKIVLQKIISLLSAPNGDHPLNAEAGELISKDRAKFDKKAQEHTKQYAM